MEEEIRAAVSEVVRRLKEAEMCSDATLVGVTDEELAALERQLGLRFPYAYREYLRVMGRGAGTFLGGTDIFYDQVIGLEDSLQSVLEQEGIEHIVPSDALVFGSHQGYVFMWLCTNDGEDPPVYIYEEGKHDARVFNDTFTAFLSEMADEEIMITEKGRLLRGFNDSRKTNPAIAYDYATKYVLQLQQHGYRPPDWMVKWLEEYLKPSEP